jgi:Fungal chitosanase of glycosyl hydrolase group 75
MSKVINQLWTNGGDNSSKPIVVILDNGHVLITSDADTDADGSLDARIIDPNSGQDATSLGKDNGWKGANEYVDASSIPYYVLPLNWEALTGITCTLGDIAKLTYKNKSIYAIYADNGSTNIIGEASIVAIESLGGDPWNSEHKQIISGIPFGVTYEVIPQSSNLGRTVSYESIQSYGKELFEGFPSDKYNAVTWLELNRDNDGSPAVTAYDNSGPKYTRYYKTKEDLIEFLQAFPSAHTAPVAATDKKLIPDCPDLRDPIKEEQHSDAAIQFVTYFEDNYGAVRAEVERWFLDDNPQPWSYNAIHNGCVAHQVSCLSLCNLPHPTLDTLESVRVDCFVEWALKNGWTKITKMDQIKAGDICVSGPSISDLDHVYCFVKYIDSDNAYVLHNQVFGLATRSLIGDGCGPWRFALRMP